jgi:hypothetical protein
MKVLIERKVKRKIKRINTSLLPFLSLICCLALTACSSTQNSYSDSSLLNTSNTPMNNGYYAKSFTTTTTVFEAHSTDSVKKAAFSDHQLMLTLLNRPITADQAMMQNFERERAQYAHSYYAQKVEIKGDRSSDISPNNHSKNTRERAQHAYAHLINQDINSVAISSMPK